MKILITCIVLFGILVLTNATSCSVRGSIAFAIDGSDSISKPDFARMIEFTIKTIDSFDLGNDKIQVGALVYSTSVASNGFFNLATDRSYIEKQIKKFEQPQDGTNTELAITKLGEILQNSKTNVGVVITDGESKDPKKTIAEAEKLRKEGVTLVAIGIGKKVNTDELRGIAGSDSLVMTISFDDLTSVTTIAEIKKLLCQAIPPPKKVIPTPKKALCRGPGSVAMAIDGSDSISRQDFARMIEFTIKNIDSFELGDNMIRVGALVYSNDVPSFFNLATDRTNIETQIKNFVQPADGSRTDLAIIKLGTILQNSKTKVGVVITDGVSKHYNQTITEATKLRNTGVTIVAVGIGSQVNKVELREIAGRDSLVKMITLSELTSITMIEEVNSLLCEAVTNDLCRGCVISHGFGYNYIPGDCTKFVVCFPSVDSSGNEIVKAQIKQCGYGTYWSQEKHTCDNYKSTTCETDICKGKSDGYTLPYLGCRSYWSCMNALPVPDCCSSGQIFSGSRGGSCVDDDSNACSNVVCSPNHVIPTVAQCTRTENKNNRATYYEKVHGRDILRHCAPGTLFSKDTCVCGVHGGTVEALTCNPKIKQGRNAEVGTQGEAIHKFIGAHGQYISNGARNVDFTTSQRYAIFGAGGAHSEINFWSLANAHFDETFAVSFSMELTRYTGGTGTARKEQVLDNCLCHTEVGDSVVKHPSISIQVEKRPRNQYVFTAYIETYIQRKTLTITQTSSGGFLDVTMAYNGSNIVFKVGGKVVTTQLTGQIERRNAGLIFGRPTTDDIDSHKVNFLQAKMKNIVIYDCITKSLQDDLNNM